MTVIRPNSITGITSITAQANEINIFRSNGTIAGLNLNGVNFNTTTGVSTFNNLEVGGVLTYQDVTNVDSLGIGTFILIEFFHTQAHYKMEVDVHGYCHQYNIKNPDAFVEDEEDW